MIKIISDSSSNVYSLKDVPYAYVSLIVNTPSCEFIDNGDGDTLKMCQVLKNTDDKSSTSCPSVGDWLEAFSDDDDNICFTISSNLSGSYSSCLQAKEIYEEEHNHRVMVVDTLATGPKMHLLIEKTVELIKDNKTIDEIYSIIKEYQNNTHIYFYTASVKNLVNAGRIPSLIGKAVSIFKISMCGIGSKEGKIKIIHQSRNMYKTLDFIYEKFIEKGYKGGKVKISHCFNDEGTNYFINLIKNQYPHANIDVINTGILCSYYVEEKGIIMAFEGTGEQDI